uniref:Junctophilin n=1 Tax=Romanomermis culicivorax TaxID=13658 RepID=A0A915KBJ9_ROMCU
MIASPSGSLNGGRFDFDDGGSYCGGWEEGKAHGHGVCTGPKGQGEYSGAWHYGFEVSGIYTWPSGNSYEGQWQNGKRHGLGVERRGRWAYKGEWSQGFKGRYGVRFSVNSSAKYEGTWANGLQDGYGQETYADGGTYQGQWMRGMRHGYGIRKSAQYSVASKFRARSHAHASLTSLRSDQSEENYDKQTDRSTEDSRGGFVLKARSEPPTRRRSLSERSLAVKRTILHGLRGIKKQRSTGDIDQKGQPNGMGRSGSVTSCGSDESSNTGASSRHQKSHDSSTAYFPVEEFIDPNAVETYIGEWKNDKRSGFGVSERSDGLKYEGEWFANRKTGYGVTTFKDGTKEEGKYKNNVLVTSQRKKHLLFVRTSKLRERIDNAVSAAQRAVQLAMQKAEIGVSRSVTSRERADQADVAALQAREDAEVAKAFARQLSPEFNQTTIDPYKKIQMEVANHVMGITPKLPKQVSYERPPSADLLTQMPGLLQHPVNLNALSQQQHQHPPPPPSALNTSQAYENLLLKMAQQRQPMATGGTLSSVGYDPGSMSRAQLYGQTGFAQQQQQQQFQHQMMVMDQNLGIPQQSTPTDESRLIIPEEVRKTSSVMTLDKNMDDVNSFTLDEKRRQQASSAGVSGSKAPPPLSQAVKARNQPQQQAPTPSRPNVLRTASNSHYSVNAQPYDLYDFYGGRRRCGGAFSKSFDQSVLGPSTTPDAVADGDEFLPSTSMTVPAVANNARRSTAGPDAHMRAMAMIKNGTTRPPSFTNDVSYAKKSAAINFSSSSSPPSPTRGRGSEPDLAEIFRDQRGSGAVMSREEISRLSSQRRQELQRMREEQELMQHDALFWLRRQLADPRIRTWIWRWKLPLLMVLFNVCLSIIFCQLLTYSKNSNDDKK